MTKTEDADQQTQLTPIVQVELSDDFAVLVAGDDGPINWARYAEADGTPIFDIDLRGKDVPVVKHACATCHHATSPYEDRVSVSRACNDCGQPRFHVSDAPGTGPRVAKGERVFVPRSVLERSLFLTNGGTFSQHGVAWLARLHFGGPVGLLPTSATDFARSLEKVAAFSRSIFEACPALQGIDLDTQDGVASAIGILRAMPNDAASPAFIANAKAQYVSERVTDAIDDTDTTSLAMAAWTAAVNFALLRFKLHFEEASYRGNSLEQLRWLHSEWERNSTNHSESYWQELLLSRPFALAQLLSAPVVLHGERYFVGGIRAGGKHGKIADFLFRNQLTDAAAIVEIKTPTAQLLSKTEYRQDVYSVASEVSGAISQVLEQRAQFMKNMQALQAELETDVPRVEVVEPHCVVLVGSTTQLDSRAKKRCFETFRSELRTVRLVTFDELFARIRALTLLLGATDQA